MRGVLGLVVVAACGGSPPLETTNTELPQKTAAPAPLRWVTSAPRPAIDISSFVPDFHEELRWPLTGMNHPTLEPRFAVAQQLAMPGIEWEELCARGVHNRVSATQKELQTYLRGWCGVVNRDVDAACANLASLIGSVTRGLTPAVRQDLANILVDSGDADKAEHWLSRHNIRDIPTLDLLAANYVEAGSLADASAINRRAIDSDGRATDATKCYRLARRIVIGLETETILLAANELKDLATKPKVPDPTCTRLHHKVACWRSHTDCADFYVDENIDPRATRLVEAYYAWPRGEAPVVTWWDYAEKAQLALPTLGGVELVVTALEAIVRARRGCPYDIAAHVHRKIKVIRLAPTAADEARLRNLEAACPKP